ncbi:MAG: T9SS type A sorting domain-containing protein [Lishizhenia sp.]
MIKSVFILIVLLFSLLLRAQSYPGPVGSSTTDAIANDSQLFTNWATGVEIKRGFLDIEDTLFEVFGTNRAFFGYPNNALGYASGVVGDIVSLGDGGEAILTFDWPISNGNGPDFAVFENSFDDSFLELAFVEVSSDGIHFVRFPSHSQTQLLTQVNGFGNLQASRLHNLAGKYRGGYGTPFDLEDLQDSSGIDIQNINYVKIIDAVGSIGDSARYDALGNKINDPYPTPYESGGFDLDGVGVIHQTVGISEEKKPEIYFYPNPAKEFIQFNQKVEAVEIFNSVGRSVYSSKEGELVLLNLPKGIYFVSYSFQSKYFRGSLVVN